MSVVFHVPFVIRGEILHPSELPRAATLQSGFLVTPDAASSVGKLTIAARDMTDLTALRLPDVIEYLHELSDRLRPAHNEYVREAYEASRRTSALPDATLRSTYEQIPGMFNEEAVQRRARALLPVECLEEWVDLPPTGASRHARVRAFGARTVHIIAGNTPAIAAATILNNALTHGDALIKTSSNDLLSAVAIARTMIEMAPDHPLTRHVSVAYWKGGDRRVEHVLYNARHIDKIVAWGGVASIRHITRELSPGVDLITLDPKYGVAILDGAALIACSDDEIADVASRLALDIGTMSQEACFNTRLVYVLGNGKREHNVARRLGQLVYDALQALPASASSGPRVFDPELKAELEALRLVDSDHLLIGARANEGAIIVSTGGEPVEFAHHLSGRVANIITMPGIDGVLAAIGTSSQTVTVYPEALKRALRDTLACCGAQRIVPLGCATMDPQLAAPHDGMELLRRMCKWIVEEA